MPPRSSASRLAAPPLRRRAGLLLAALLLTGAAANDPAQRLPDPAQEARARRLFQEVRCLVCQNESIDESEALLAGDLRRVVRTQVREGRSDAEVRRFLTDRYGEFVLLRPSFSPGNAVLWLTPFGIVLAGGAVLALRTRRPPPEAALTPEEQARLAGLETSTEGTGAKGHDLA